MSAPLDVDGSRPAVARVAALPAAYWLTSSEMVVLYVLAADSFDGQTSSLSLPPIKRRLDVQMISMGQVIVGPAWTRNDPMNREARRAAAVDRRKWLSAVAADPRTTPEELEIAWWIASHADSNGTVRVDPAKLARSPG